MCGPWWRGACFLPSRPHPEWLPYRHRPRGVERSQSWLAAPQHLAGPHSLSALLPKYKYWNHSTVTLPSTAKGTGKECVCV